MTVTCRDHFLAIKPISLAEHRVRLAGIEIGTQLDVWMFECDELAQVDLSDRQLHLSTGNIAEAVSSFVDLLWNVQRKMPSLDETRLPQSAPDNLARLGLIDGEHLIELHPLLQIPSGPVLRARLQTLRHALTPDQRIAQLADVRGVSVASLLFDI